MILDPATRQIASADVVLADTGRLVRVPWRSSTIQHDGILLSTAESQAEATVPRASGAGLPDTVILEVTTAARTSS
ncbi:MAG: hypothetical protein C4293_17075 [Nitrospiraceae bacterium]